MKQQDWVAVLIDLAVVMIGVFLGIQASNWNEWFKDRQSADAYLGRIAEDLTSDTRELDQRETYWRTSQEAGQRALRYAEEGRPDGTSWQTLNDFYDAGQLWVYAPNDATYRELVSAGHLDLVRDVQLRRQLGD